MDKKAIGKIIKEKREKNNLTQLQVANETGISRNYISDIEGGRYMPSVETLCKIAIALKLNLNFLTRMSEIQDNIKEVI